MTKKFNEEQMNYIKSILQENNIPNDIIKLSDDQVCSLFEKASIYLMKHGFNKNYEPTNDGLMCESILDILGDL